MPKVPNTTNFTLQDVYDSVHGHAAGTALNLQSCFTNAVSGYFDPTYNNDTYNGSALQGMKRFRNYTPVVNSYGKRQMAVVSAGDIFISDDYGVTWIAQGQPGDWAKCAISANGDYFLGNEVGTGYASKGVGFPVSWSNILDPTKDWDAVGISYTGQYQIVASSTASGSLGHVYGSTDYGSTWSLTPASYRYWGTVAISGSGQYTYLGSIFGQIGRFATPFGLISYSEIAAPPGTSGIISLGTVANGQTVYVVIYESTGSNYHLYKSTDFGNTWTYVTNLTGSADIAVSSTGQYVMYQITSGTYTGRIFNSSDYGSSWSYYDTSQSGGGVSMDQTGQYRLVSGFGYLYRSSDYGATWIQVTSAGNRLWVDVAI